MTRTKKRTTVPSPRPLRWVTAPASLHGLPGAVLTWRSCVGFQGVAVRRSSRSANRKQKSYKYDIDSDELLEDGETKKDKEEKQAGSGGEEDAEMAPADVEVDAVFAARFTDVAIENDFSRDFVRWGCQC